MVPVIAVLDDLLFLSRIREAARGTQVEVRVLRRPDEAGKAAEHPPRLVLVDADGERLPWPAIVQALRAQPALAGVPVVAFVSHVNATRAALAREAGADSVLARSAFVQQLPALLAAAVDSSSQPEEDRT